MNTIIETPRIIIREFLPEEMDAFLNHFNDEDVRRYLTKRSREERAEIFRKAIEQYGTGTALAKWGMFNKQDGAFIGSCLLRVFNADPEKVEMGYSIDKKYWGKGLGSEMAKALVAYAFQDEKVKEVVGCTALENIASQRVLEKAGLKRMGNLIKDDKELAVFKKSRD